MQRYGIIVEIASLIKIMAAFLTLAVSFLANYSPLFLKLFITFYGKFAVKPFARLFKTAGKFYNAQYSTMWLLKHKCMNRNQKHITMKYTYKTSV